MRCDVVCTIKCVCPFPHVPSCVICLHALLLSLFHNNASYATILPQLLVSSSSPARYDQLYFEYWPTHVNKQDTRQGIQAVHVIDRRQPHATATATSTETQAIPIEYATITGVSGMHPIVAGIAYKARGKARRATTQLWGT